MKPLAAVAHTFMYISLAILRHVTPSSHVALTLVCWLLHGVFLNAHLEDEEGRWCKEAVSLFSSLSKDFKFLTNQILKSVAV